MVVGGKDKTLFSTDPNVDSIVNLPNDSYSMLVGTLAAGGIAGVKAPGAIMDYVDTKTKPKVEGPDLVDYENRMDKYTKDLEEYDKIINKQEEDKQEAIGRAKAEESVAYKSVKYTNKQLLAAANKVMPEIINMQVQELQDSTNDIEDMAHWEVLQDRIDATDAKSVKESIKDGSASAEVMDMVKKQAYRERVNLPTPTEIPKTQLGAAMEKAGVTIEKPKAPNLDFKVDTSKMSTKVLARMEEDTTKVDNEEVVDLLLQGKSAKQIAAALEVKPRVIRSVMALKGIPNTNTVNFKAWATTKNYQTLKEQYSEVKAKSENIKQTVVTPRQAQLKIDNVSYLKSVGAKTITDIKPGEVYIQKLGQNLGVDVVFYEAKTDAKGIVQGLHSGSESRTVFINRKAATSGQATTFLLGHEFLHSVRTNHPNLYKDLRSVMGEGLSSEQVKKLLDAHNSDPGYQAKLSEDKELLIEEMLADEAGSLFTDPEFWKNVQAKNPSVAQRLAQVLRDFINRVLGRKTKLDVMTELQVKEFQSKFEDAVASIVDQEYKKKLQDSLGVGEKEAEIGALALKDLEAKFSIDTESKVIAKGISEEFMKEGIISLQGRQIEGTRELAILAQVYRDPRFETIRYFFVDSKDKIVHTTGVSSRMPGVSSIAPNGVSVNAFISDNIKRGVNKGATGFYVLHNHPSGTPTPSDADILVTKRLSQETPIEMKSHVIINSNKYATIDGEGNTEVLDLNFEEDKILLPTKDHPVLGTLINSPNIVARLGKKLQAPEGYSTLIYTSTRGVVIGVNEVPTKYVSLNSSFKSYLEDSALDTGGDWVFLVTDDGDAFKGSKPLIEQSYLKDVLKSGKSAREEFNLLTSDDMWMGRAARVSAKEVHFSKKKDLVALHGITEDKLNKALELGGFVVPSIAVTKDSIAFNKYGPVTLVGNSSIVDPQGLVGFDEFNAALVESFVSEETRSKLEDKGIVVIEYEGEESWQEAMSATEALNTRFKISKDFVGGMSQKYGPDFIEKMDLKEQKKYVINGNRINDLKYKIKAYHGTPHQVEKFTTDKIGTGEGQQVYGWGLYFAGDRNVANWYRNRLTEGRQAVIEVEGKDVIRFLRDVSGSNDVYYSVSGYIGRAYYNLKKLSGKDIKWGMLETLAKDLVQNVNTGHELYEVDKPFSEFNSYEELSDYVVEKESIKDMKEIDQIKSASMIAFREYEEINSLFRHLEKLQVPPMTVKLPPIGTVYGVDLDIDPKTETLDWYEDISEQKVIFDKVLDYLSNQEEKIAEELDKAVKDLRDF